MAYQIDNRTVLKQNAFLNYHQTAIKRFFKEIPSLLPLRVFLSFPRSIDSWGATRQRAKG